MKDEPQLSAEIKDKLLTEREFYENTMGCFYQDELRAHDRAMRKRLATALEEQNKRFLSQLKERKYLISKDGMAEEYLQELINDYEDILNGKGE